MQLATVMPDLGFQEVNKPYWMSLTVFALATRKFLQACDILITVNHGCFMQRHMHAGHYVPRPATLIPTAVTSPAQH